MNQLKKLLFIFASACLLLILVPSVSYANTSTTTNIYYDSTGNDPNGYRAGNQVSIGDWNTQAFNLNKTWEACAALKIGCTIDNSSSYPPLNVDYVLSVFDGNKWTDTNAIVNISQKNVEYIFEPVFADSIDIKAVAVHPTFKPYDNYYSWSNNITIYSITQGFADQAAFVDDFDFGIAGSTVQNNRDFSYNRIIHFYDTSILKIGNNYYLKGKYWLEGSSRVCKLSPNLEYQKVYQLSSVEVYFNGKLINSSGLSGTPDDNSFLLSAYLQNKWYFPEGESFFIPIGSTTPTVLRFYAKHSGYSLYSGDLDLIISETTTDKNINVDINNFPLINSISNPTLNKIFSEADTNLAPVISVSDVDNQSLTCKYFVDNETTPRDTKTVTNSSVQKTVSFAGFNAGALSDGIHNIRFEIYDGKNTTKMSRGIKVDRKAPIINKLVIDSTTSSITVKGLAADTVCSTDSLVYNINIASSADGGTNSAYTSSNTYTKSGLLPNTKYYISVKVRDTYGHTSSYQGVFYTKK